ncbi:STAS domain-containing protein [Actinomadura kijaniata]|uniref:STAS domain-containing protein n=1 Tax=Actinomadura kijaniata TaxID=46161 RepID=UPI003F1DF25A
MSGILPPPLRLTLTRRDPRTLRVRLDGDLDYLTSDRFLATVLPPLEDEAGLAELELDCAGLGLCDSAGLAALLMVRRRANAASVNLHLDHRPDRLNHLLELTGTLHHLTGRPAPAQPRTRPGRA